jgi:hypothetical protein
VNDCLWIKRGNALIPADPVTEDIIAEIKNATFVSTSAPRNRRNPQFHRLMMAVLQKVVEHTAPRFADIEDLMNYLKLKTGMVKAVEWRGYSRLVFRSVSFASMSEQQFRRVSDRWLYVISTEIMPGVDPETLLEEAQAA